MAGGWTFESITSSTKWENSYNLRPILKILRLDMDQNYVYSVILPQSKESVSNSELQDQVELIASVSEAHSGLLSDVRKDTGASVYP